MRNIEANNELTELIVNLNLLKTTLTLRKQVSEEKFVFCMINKLEILRNKIDEECVEK